MKIVEPYAELRTKIPDGNEYLKEIEDAARYCYMSHDRTTPDSAARFVKSLIESGHHAMLEHAPDISFLFCCSIGIAQQITRHRHFSFAQESTRYCNYGKDKYGGNVQFIVPIELDSDKQEEMSVMSWVAYDAWQRSCLTSEESYFKIIKSGYSPEVARDTLPRCAATHLVVKGNAQEWRHFFTLRTAKDAQTHMRNIAASALKTLQSKIPVLFDDIQPYKAE